VSLAIRAEAHSAVQEALGRLDPDDREVIVLRGIEQSPFDEVAAVIGTTPDAARKRYGRALQRLRALVPGSVYDELPESA
jgi:RNA polymerase sigma-70 factor (ECF subfamily)